MDRQKDQVERKLIELETAVESEPSHSVTVPESSTDLKAELTTDVKSELFVFGGIVSIVLGLFMLFQHVKVTTGFMSALGLGGQGFGLLMIPLLIGIGWIMYDAKSLMGWAITVVSCLVIFFTVLSGLIMTFPTTSLLGLIM